MPHWYEVFENDRVQYVTRARIARLFWLGFGTLLVVVAGTLFVLTRQVPLGVGVPVIGLALVLPGTYVAWSVADIARIVWCIKLSDRHLVGYDFARRRRVFDWTTLDRIDLAAKGLRLVRHDGAELEVPHLFPDFAALSHRIVAYAEFYGIPVCIDAQPWQDADLRALYGVDLPTAED